MIVHQRVAGHGGDGAFLRGHGLVIAAKPIQHPTQRIEDIAIIRRKLDRAFDQAQGLVHVLTAIDIGIAEIVQQLRIVRADFQRRLQIRLGPVEQALTFQRDGAGIKREPAFVGIAFVDQCQRLVIGGHGLGPFFLLAQQVAKRDPALRQVGPGGSQRQCCLFRIAHAVGPGERVDAQKLGRGAQLALFAQLVEFGLGLLELAHGLQHLRDHQPGIGHVGRDIAGHAGMDQRQRVRVDIVGQKRREGQEDLGNPVAGVLDQIEFHRLPGREFAGQLVGNAVDADPLDLFQHRQGVLAPVKLGQDLRLGDGGQDIAFGRIAVQQLCGSLEIADKRLCQCQMVVDQPIGTADLADTVESGIGIGGLAFAQKRPGPQHPVQQLL